MQRAWHVSCSCIGKYASIRACILVIPIKVVHPQSIIITSRANEILLSNEMHQTSHRSTIALGDCSLEVGPDRIVNRYALYKLHAIIKCPHDMARIYFSSLTILIPSVVDIPASAKALFIRSESSLYSSKILNKNPPLISNPSL